MKQNFYIKSLLIALFVLFGGGGIFAAVETITFSEQGYQNQQEMGEVKGDNIKIIFNKGKNSNAPKYFTSGTAVRAYGGNYFTVSSRDYNITQIVIEFGSSDGSNTISTDVGTYNNGTWTGNNTSVTFTIGGSTGNRRIETISVTYDSGQDKITPTLTFDAEVVNLIEGEEYTPSLTKPTGVEVSYSIEDETIATLYDTGHLKALKAGNTIVTVTSEENDTYLPASATFTLNVADKLSAVGTYEWVKDAKFLVAGDELIFVYNGGNPPVAMGPQREQYNNFGNTEVIYSDGITDKSLLNVSSEDVTVIKLEGNTSAYYFHTNNGYLYASSSGSNQLKTATLKTAGNNGKADITISNGNATIKFQGSNTRNLLKYNDTNSLFSCYSSGQKSIQIYRKVPSNVPPTITFSPASGTEVNYGTQVTITARTATSITYSVNDGEAVTVEGTSATVTINMHSTITARATNDYGTCNPVTAEYTIHAESPAFTYDPTEYEITIGDDFTAPELGKAADYDGTVTYSSDNTEVAEVDAETGAVTVKGAGTATITATGTATEHYAEATASYTLTVNKQESAVSFADPVVEITYGDNYDKQKATAQGFSGDLVYTSSDESVVKFHGNNVIDVLKAGTVTITATAPSTDTTEESSATYTLKIYEPADAVEGLAVLLNETFGDCKGSNPKTNFGGNSSGFTNVPSSLTEAGWDLTRCQAADGYLKVSSSDNGIVITPELELNGASEFSFEIAPWVSETATVTVSLENATFEDGTSTSKSFNDLEQSTWKTKTFSIIGNGKVRIKLEATRRIFIDNFIVGGGAQPAHEINLTFSSAGYLTWVATADIDFSQTEGVTAYQITEATSKKITMVEVDKVPEGAAVMLKGSDTKTLKRTTEEVADLSDNKMKACTDGSVTGNGNGVTNTDVYVLGNGKSGLGFYMLKGTLQAGKGYLQVSEGTGNAKPNFISFEETTGVKTVVINKDSDGEVYSLQGIRVAHPQKGIYVKNGKKYVIK